MPGQLSAGRAIGGEVQDWLPASAPPIDVAVGGATIVLPGYACPEEVLGPCYDTMPHWRSPFRAY